MRFIGGVMLVFASACVVWPAQALIRRLRGRRLQAARGARGARPLAGIICGLNLFFLIGLRVTLGRIDLYEFLYGMPGQVAAFLVLPLATTALTAVLLIVAVLAWKRSYWSILERLYFTVVTAAALSFVSFVAYWNLLGVRF